MDFITVDFFIISKYEAVRPWGKLYTGFECSWEKHTINLNMLSGKTETSQTSDPIEMIIHWRWPYICKEDEEKGKRNIWKRLSVYRAEKPKRATVIQNRLWDLDKVNNIQIDFFPGKHFCLNRYRYR